jgi:hypothetical protein
MYICLLRIYFYIFYIFLIFKKWDREAGTGLIWLRIGTGGRRF